jgi:hypothetical protein
MRQVRVRAGRAETHEIERGRLLAGHDRAAGVSMATMMGLVVEQVQQDVLQHLLVPGAPDMFWYETVPIRSASLWP